MKEREHKAVLLGSSFYKIRVRYQVHVWRPVDARPCTMCESCKINIDPTQHSRRARLCENTMVVLRREDKRLATVWVHRALFPSQHLPELSYEE